MSSEEPYLVGEQSVDEQSVDEQSVDTLASVPGDPRVDAALRRAAELAATLPTEHVEIYEDVHRRLQEVLADASGQPAAATESPGPATGDAVR